MSSTLVELDKWKTDSPTDLHWRSDTKFTDIVAFRHKLLKFLEGDWGLWHIIGGTCFWMTLVHSAKSNKVYTCFWQTSQDFMVLLYNGNCLLPQNDNNKMATDITSMWFNKWFFPPANEVCEGYVSTGVCLSTHPPEQTPLIFGQTHPPPGEIPPLPGCGQQVGGTHPTGMHSCTYQYIYLLHKSFC